MFSLRPIVLAATLLLAWGAHAADAPGASRITQDLVDRQPARIDARIREIFEQQAGPGPRTYFLGFAGVGEEHVFAEEIDLAERRLVERYGPELRSLRLVNDQRDLERYPLASPRALRYALHELGRIMYDDEVLFLVLSSHGWKNSIAVSNAGEDFESLYARDLAQMLHDSGIPWRVIIISACYSGSFVKALSNDRTIVITAAAKNRPSFGCGSDRDLTYFGEAFWRDALPRAASMREAFESARVEITEREKQEGERPSHPQGFFGTLMESKLAEMEMGPGPISPPPHGSSVAPIR